MSALGYTCSGKGDVAGAGGRGDGGESGHITGFGKFDGGSEQAEFKAATIKGDVTDDDAGGAAFAIADANGGCTRYLPAAA